MKHLYHFVMAALLVLSTMNLQASLSLEPDSVTMGAGYANDIYYSLSDGEVASVDRSNWDIAFYTSAISDGIITNGGAGVELYTYPHSDISGWASVDTAGLSGWKVMYNSTENWETGAFNRHALGHPDYGWGVYNMVSHIVVGDSLFIIKFGETSTKKLWIVEKSQNTFHFKYADLDGSNEETVELFCGDYSSKNFVYYSIQNGEVLDREPDASTWDILFTKYIDILDGGTPYAVTGVLNNIDVPANRFDEVEPDFVDWSSKPMDSTKVSIGYDWKHFDMVNYVYEVEDSISFFISTRETDVYKFVPSVFDYTNGKIVFSTSLGSPAAVSQVKAPEMILYPNPASNFFTIRTEEGFTADELRITDLSGRLVQLNQSVDPAGRIDISNLPSGVYLVNLSSGDETIIEKLLIQR